MSERRMLIEGLKPAAPAVDPRVEQAFIFGYFPTTMQPTSL